MTKPSPQKFDGWFSANEGFRQQLCQFLPDCSSKHVKLTVNSPLIDVKLQNNEKQPYLSRDIVKSA
jgi:hypothetical protein